MNQPSNRDPLLNVLSHYSIGTSFAIDAIEYKYLNRGTRKPNVVAINVATLIRNRLGQDKSVLKSKLFEQIRNEILVLVEDLAAILRHSGIKNPSVLVYLFDYKRQIPVSVSRPYDGARKIQQESIEYIVRRFKEMYVNEYSVINSVNIFFELYKDRILAHKQLVRLMRKVSSVQTCLMFSHCPLDYHLSQHIKQFLLVESHTGKIKETKELGKKIFKKENIPFNALTHALLGDKDYIKSPLPVKDRKRIYDLAKTNHWEIRSDSYVRKDMLSLGLKPAINFN